MYVCWTPFQVLYMDEFILLITLKGIIVPPYGGEKHTLHRTSSEWVSEWMRDWMRQKWFWQCLPADYFSSSWFRPYFFFFGSSQVNVTLGETLSELRPWKMWGLPESSFGRGLEKKAPVRSKRTENVLVLFPIMFIEPRATMPSDQ